MMTYKFSNYESRWKLSEPTLLASTLTSFIYKVKYQKTDAILKIFTDKGQKSETKGALALSCFAGKGALHLLNADADAYLIEYLDGQSLKNITTYENDKRITEIICEVVEKLHSYSSCDLLAKHLKVDPLRILEYAFVYGCLSACWFLEDAQNPNDTLRMARNIYQVLQNLTK